MSSFHYDAASIEEITIAQLQAAMQAGELTAQHLVELYLERIQALNPMLNAIIEINPDALDIARTLDQERASTGPRGPMHGIPVLLKENIATVDKMQTTAGSLALLGSRPPRNAYIVSQLHAAGAVILGKANLSEWANFRSTTSSSGWSARGGQCHNPYVLDRTPCGSSSGSAVAVAANLSAVAIGTETDGSILCPSNTNGVVGIKPTVGLTSRSGVIPIAHSQDSVGPFGRTVADAAILLGAMTGVDTRDSATLASKGQFHTDYTRFLDAQGLQGVRIGIPRHTYFGYNRYVDNMANAAIELMRKQGAIIIDPADIPTVQQINASEAEMTVLLYEFKADLNAYLAQLEQTEMHTLADLIAFNKAHADEEMPYFEQELFLQAEETTSLNDPDYLVAREECLRLSRNEGIDAIMEEHQLDALVMPTGSPAWCIDLINGDTGAGGCSQIPALAGYPAISVPAGYLHEVPLGLTFTGRAFSEPTLIRLAYAFEQASRVRRPPRYLPTVQ